MSPHVAHIPVSWSSRKPGEPRTCLMSSNLWHVSTDDTLVTVCMHEQMCASGFFLQKYAAGIRTQIRKNNFFLGHWVFDAIPLCHYGTQTKSIITPHPTPPLLGLKMKCQNPKAERDHNKLIINRKRLHYGLKDRREWSLVTALTQIHTFLQGLGRARSPLWTAQPLPQPRGIAQGTAGTLKGFGGPWRGAGGLRISRVAQ